MTSWMHNSSLSLSLTFSPLSLSKPSLLDREGDRPKELWFVGFAQVVAFAPAPPPLTAADQHLQAAAMPPSKSRSGLNESTNNKSNTAATPRVSKIRRTPCKSESDLRSPMPGSRLSVDRSPKSVDSKAALERRFSKTLSTPDKQPRVAAKALELEERLNAIQQDFEKTKEKLISVEVEKAQILEELKEAKIHADEANEKLLEALAAQKCAEANSEIEKFRAIELEQAGIEAAQQREEVWQKEIENVRNQHALNVSALVSATHELQRVKQELAMSTEAKNTALSHADDAMKIAEINAEKVDVLSGEIARLKLLLDAKMENMNDEAAEKIKKLNLEINGLKLELERAKETAKSIAEMESLVEGLKVELANAKRSYSDACDLVNEWKKKVELLELKLEGIIQSERSKSECLASTTKQLEECNSSLQDAESEITCLKGKVESLETEIEMHKLDLDEVDGQLEVSKQEQMELGKTIEVLKSEFQHVEEEKIKALENEKQVAANVKSLLAEKENILNELEKSREELEHGKKAMDGLASALHEVSTEAREAKEQLLIKQAEVSDFEDQIVELDSTIKSTEEKYESKIDDLKDEIFRLKSDLEKSEMAAENSRSEWNTKELTFVKSLKDMEEEYAGMKGQMDEMTVKVKNAELELATANEVQAHLLEKIKEVEMDTASAQEAAEEARAKSIQLKERLLDKENELQSITQENEDLRAQEDAATEKIKELSRLLEEAMAKTPDDDSNQPRGEEGPTEASKAIDATDVVANGAQACKVETVEGQTQQEDLKEDEANADGTCKQEESMESESKKPDHKVADKGVPPPEPETESEPADEDLDLKLDSESFHVQNGSVENGGCSPIKEEQQKKKKPLLRKLGNLLKKNNQK